MALPLADLLREEAPAGTPAPLKGRGQLCGGESASVMDRFFGSFLSAREASGDGGGGAIDGAGADDAFGTLGAVGSVGGVVEAAAELDAATVTGAPRLGGVAGLDFFGALVVGVQDDVGTGVVGRAGAEDVIAAQRRHASEDFFVSLTADWVGIFGDVCAEFVEAQLLGSLVADAGTQRACELFTAFFELLDVATSGLGRIPSCVFVALGVCFASGKSKKSGENEAPKVHAYGCPGTGLFRELCSLYFLAARARWS